MYQLFKNQNRYPVMKLERQYHFYAAHRNPEAGEKCGRIHGHTYKVIVTLNFRLKDNGITMLFQDVDDNIERIVKKFDHFFMIWREDPLYGILMEAGEAIYGVDFPTSAENVAKHLWECISKTGLPITKLQLKETESSNIIIGD